MFVEDYSHIKEYDALSRINPCFEGIFDDDDLDFRALGAAANDINFHEIDLTIPQMEFFLLENKYPLFVAGMGSGKSLTLAVCAVRDLVNFPGSDIAVYAPTFDLLKLIVVAYLAEILDAGGYEFTYHGGEHIFYVKGYGRIICRSLDNPSRIVGYETFRAHCDEFDTLKEEKAKEAWEKVIARNRQKIYVLDDNGNKIHVLNNDGSKKRYKDDDQFVYEMELNRVSAYTTPEGWRFAYNRWVRDKKPDDKFYNHVTASTRSNEHNLPPDYIESMMETYSPELAEAYIEGKFTNLTSGRVYRNFDRKLNSCDSVVEGLETLHIGMDFNIEHGSAVISVDRFNKETGVQEDHIVDEVKDSFDTAATIKYITEKYPNNPIKVYPDASGKKRSSSNTGVNTKGEATQTDLALLRKAGFTVVVNLSNPPIKDRVAALSARICNGKGERFYFVNIKNCPAHTETLEKQVYDSNGMPDKSGGLDHSGDAGGYTAIKRHPVVKTKVGYLRT